VRNLARAPSHAGSPGSIPGAGTGGTSTALLLKKKEKEKNVRNLARAYHRTKTLALLLKLDISKAFDLVSWEYLLELMEKRGFPCRWRDWLAMLLTTSSSSVLLKGVPGPLIKHWRGLRQGDPLSPYLFILAMDTLQKLFQRATEEGSLSTLRGRHANIFMRMMRWFL
jgi:hypothetical protein